MEKDFTFWRKRFDTFGFEVYPSGLEAANTAWLAWIRTNSRKLLADIEEDCAPQTRYHYVIQPSSVGDSLYVVFEGQRFFLGDDGT